MPTLPWRSASLALALAFASLGAACGGGEDALPLLSGSVEGSYAGAAFTAENGFATMLDGDPIIGVGDGPLHCGSPASSEPPEGRNVLIVAPAFEVGVYDDVFVNLYENVDDFEAIGSNGGRLELTAVSDASVAGTITFELTNDEDEVFTVDGSFEITRCADE